MSVPAIAYYVEEIKKANFSPKKLSKLTELAPRLPSSLSASEVAELIKIFDYAKDRTQAVSILARHYPSFSASALAAILKTVQFSNERKEVLKTVIPLVSDKWNEKEILDSCTFEAEKKLAKDLLQQQRSGYSHHQPHVNHPHGHMSDNFTEIDPAVEAMHMGTAAFGNNPPMNMNFFSSVPGMNVKVTQTANPTTGGKGTELKYKWSVGSRYHFHHQAELETKLCSGGDLHVFLTCGFSINILPSVKSPSGDYLAEIQIEEVSVGINGGSVPYIKGKSLPPHIGSIGAVLSDTGKLTPLRTVTVRYIEQNEQLLVSSVERNADKMGEWERNFGPLNAFDCFQTFGTGWNLAGTIDSQGKFHKKMDGSVRFSEDSPALELVPIQVLQFCEIPKGTKYNPPATIIKDGRQIEVVGAENNNTAVLHISNKGMSGATSSNPQMNVFGGMGMGMMQMSMPGFNMNIGNNSNNNNSTTGTPEMHTDLQFDMESGMILDVSGTISDKPQQQQQQQQAGMPGGLGNMMAMHQNMMQNMMGNMMGMGGMQQQQPSGGGTTSSSSTNFSLRFLRISDINEDDHDIYNDDEIYTPGNAPSPSRDIPTTTPDHPTAPPSYPPHSQQGGYPTPYQYSQQQGGGSPVVAAGGGGYGAPQQTGNPCDQNVGTYGQQQQQQPAHPPPDAMYGAGHTQSAAMPPAPPPQHHTGMYGTPQQQGAPPPESYGQPQQQQDMYGGQYGQPPYTAQPQQGGYVGYPPQPIVPQQGVPYVGQPRDVPQPTAPPQQQPPASQPAVEQPASNTPVESATGYITATLQQNGYPATDIQALFDNGYDTWASFSEVTPADINSDCNTSFKPGHLRALVATAKKMTGST